MGGDAGAPPSASHFQRAFLEHWQSRISLLLGQRGGELVASGRNVLQFLFHDTNVAIAAASALMTDTCPTVIEHNLVTPTLRAVLHSGDALAFSGYSPEQSLEAAARMLALAAPQQVVATTEVYRSASDELRRDMQPRSAAGSVQPAPGSSRLYEVDWRRIVPGPAADDESAMNPTSRIVFAKATQRVQPLRDPDEAAPPPRKRKVVLPKNRPEPAAVPSATATGATGRQGEAGPLPNPRLRLSCGTEIAVVDEIVPVVTLGRSPDRNLIIKAPAVSRQHAEVRVRDGAFHLADHSANGTFVYDAQGREQIVHKREWKLPVSGCIALGASKDSNETRIILFRMELPEPSPDAAGRDKGDTQGAGKKPAAPACSPAQGMIEGDGI